MKKYLYVSPRGFANENTIYSVEQTETDQKIKAYDIVEQYNNDPNAQAYYITRKEAESITASNRQKNRLGNANYNNPAGCTEIISITDY